MPRGSSPDIQKELVAKLEKMESLIGDCVELAAQLQNGYRGATRSGPRTRRRVTTVDFGLNDRAFLKRYANKLSGGPRKFVAVLAYLAKGETAKDVPLGEIEALWSRSSSKSLLAMKFNRFFPTAAKENGWVDSKRRGFYRLESAWKEIFANDT